MLFTRPGMEQCHFLSTPISLLHFYIKIKGLAKQESEHWQLRSQEAEAGGPL